jgi:hypothetical protein
MEKVLFFNIFFILGYYQCQRTNSIQKLKLLSEVPTYDLYYSLTHPSSESTLGLKLAQAMSVLNFYQIK